MPLRREFKSKCTAIAVVLILGLAGPSTTVYAAGTGESAPAGNENAATISEPPASSSASSAAATLPSPVAAELEQLRASVQAQERQFAEHSKELESERSALQEELQRIAALETKLGFTPEPSAEPSPNVDNVLTPPPQDQKQTPINIISPEHPLSIKIGGADFTPGGFVDLTGIFRTRVTGTSSLGTNFPNIPYANSLFPGQLTEYRFTGQGSRLSLKVDEKPTESTAITGYFESDFNGYEPANANVSTKSDSFRLRLAFSQIRHDKWEVVAGQTWSLLTPTRVDLSPYPENIFTALRLDTSYLAGLVFSRQPEVRVVYHATDHWALGVALENPQQFVPSSVVFPTDGSTNFFAPQFDNGSSSTNAASASTNPLVPNLNPDITAKTSYDWNVGDKLFHIDAGGVARSFKVYNNLVTPEGTNRIVGGGGQFNFNFEVFKNFHLIENAFYGDGVGRYIGGLGPDVVVKPTGQLSGVHAGSGVAGFEWQAIPNFLVDGYASGAYFWRNYDLTTKALGTPCGPKGTEYCTGFGFVGSANTNNRDYQEFTMGFIPTIWSSPNYGKLQVISQFSYVVRVPWYVAAGQPKNAHLFMTYLNLRYIIP